MKFNLKYFFIFFVSLNLLPSCKTYYIEPDAFKDQLSNLKVVSKKGLGMDYGIVLENYYTTNLNKIYCHDKNNIYDSLYAFRRIKIFFKNKKKIRSALMYLIVEDNYLKIIKESFLDDRSSKKKELTEKNYILCPVDSISKIVIKKSIFFKH